MENLADVGLGAQPATLSNRDAVLSLSRSSSLVSAFSDSAQHLPAAVLATPKKIYPSHNFLLLTLLRSNILRLESSFR